MMDRERHNEYTNYSTWAVCTWLDNSRAFQLHTRAIVERIVTEPVAADDPVWGEAAQAVKEWVEMGLPASLSSPAAELMNAGKSDVNWLEVATTRLDENDPRAREIARTERTGRQ